MDPGGRPPDDGDSVSARPSSTNDKHNIVLETAALLAVGLNEVTGRRASGMLCLGLLGVPLGCAFLAGFIALSLLLGGALALIGLRSPTANLIVLAAALIGAFVVVVRVYRILVVRWPWLRMPH